MKKWCKLENLFVILAGIFGLVTIFLIPPFQNAPDEPTHFFRTWSMANGTFVSQDIDGKYGIKIPQEVALFPERSGFNAFDKNREIFRLNKDFFKEEFTIHPSNKKNGFFLESSAFLNPVGYVPQVVGIFIGRILHTPVIVCYWLGRVMTLAFAIYLVFLSIKIAPFGKSVFFVLALLPMSISLFSSLNPDAIGIPILFLLVSLLLHCIFDDTYKVTIIHYVAIFFMSICIASLKIVYFPVIFLFLLIPDSKFQTSPWLVNITQKKLLLLRYILFGLLLVATLSAALITFMSGVSGRAIPYMQGVNSKDQILFIVGNPLEVIGIFFTTIENFLPYYFVQFIGTMGNFLQPSLPNISYALFIVVAVYLMRSLGSDIDKLISKITIKHRLAFFGIFLASFFGIFFSLYIATNPVGAFDEMIGVQGRYFIPIAPLLIFTFYGLKLSDLHKKMVFVSLFSIAYVFALLSAYNKFYLVDFTQSLGLTPSGNSYLEGGLQKEPRFFQTFHSTMNDLSGVNIFFSTFGSRIKDDFSIVIFDETCSHVIRKQKINSYKILDNAFAEATFENISDSRDKNYCFSVVADKENSQPITIQFSAPNVYLEGNTKVDGSKSDKDVVFKLHYGN